MPNNCLTQLRDYYLAVAKVLRGEADAASVFPNTTDIGMSRERAYKEFLTQHAPSKCNVFFGGYVFDEDGFASKQLDVIVTTDTAPRFDLHNKDGCLYRCLSRNYTINVQTLTVKLGSVLAIIGSQFPIRYNS